jgi:hypothetical protein
MFNKRWFYIILIFVLAIAANYPYHTSNKITINDEFLYFHIHKFIKISLMEYKQFPLWIPYYFGGTPFFANAYSMVFTPPTLLSMLFPVEIALNISFILELFLAGLFMFLLVLELKIDEKFAFISAIAYMFNGWIMHQVVGGALGKLGTYMFFPLVFIFVIRIFTSKYYMLNGAIGGILLAIAFYASSQDTFIWFLLMVSLFLVYMLVINKLKIKMILSCVVLFLVFFGLIAMYILPLLEFGKQTNKEAGFSLEDSFQYPLTADNALKMLFTPNVNVGYPINIGFVLLIWFLLSMFRIKNRYVLFFWLFILLNIAVTMNIKIYYLLWKFIPGFSQQHEVTRNLFLMIFCCSVLAGFGSSIIFKILSERLSKKAITIVFLSLIIIVLLELHVFSGFFKPKYKTTDLMEDIQNNNLLFNLSQQEGIFRIHNIGTRAIGGHAQSYTTPLKLQILYGYLNVWITEYFNEYLAISQNQPEKFFGMLNTKYIYSRDIINSSYLDFRKKFDYCATCYKAPPEYDVDSGVDGPYLYYNQKYLPRAYIVNKSILVIGKKEDAKKIMYYIMLNESFNPANTVIILGNENLNSYSGEELRKYSLIVLSTGSIEGMIDSSKLKDYVESGGYLFPDITKEGSSYEMGELLRIVKSIKGKFDDNELYLNVKESNITDYTPNKMSIKTDNQKGFLVISEKFFMFNGWKTINLQKEILRANGINSAVYLDGSEEELSFIYRPKTFIYGEIIFFITIICLIAFFVIKKMSARVKNE